MTTRTAAWLWLCAISLASPALAADPAPAPSPPPMVEHEEPKERPLVKVVLTDGQELRGHLLAESPESVSVELLSGGRLEVPRGSIRSVGREEGAAVKDGAVWFQDPNRTRYFYAPSAMTLRKGEGYFSQKELVFTAFAYGVTDHLTVLAGTALPGWFFPNGTGINFIGGVKAGVQVADQLHLAVGAESLVLPAITSSGIVGGGFLFGAATVGGRDMHFSISAGTPFFFYGSNNALGQVILVAAGNLRVAPNLALVTENWFFPTVTTFNREPLMFNSAGVRIMGDRMAADIGLVRMPGSPVPVPWLDFTYNFAL